MRNTEINGVQKFEIWRSSSKYSQKKLKFERSGKQNEL